MRSLTRRLSMMAAPPTPPGLVSSINDALVIETAARRRHAPRPLGVRIVDWLRPRLMPYTVGSLASIILFIGMFNALRLSLTTLHDWDRAARQADVLAYEILSSEGAKGVVLDLDEPVSPRTYAADRGAFAVESPSLNPQGALAALARSSAHGHAQADDMVVVTDVYSDGSASLAGVVHAPRDRRMLDDFQSALRQDAAFVPASFDRRPETMRVIFVVHKVNVREHRF